MKRVASIKSKPQYKTPPTAYMTILVILYNARSAAQKCATLALHANNNTLSTSALYNARAATERYAKGAWHANKNALSTSAGVAQGVTQENRNPHETSATIDMPISTTSGEVVIQWQMLYKTQMPV